MLIRKYKYLLIYIVVGLEIQWARSEDWTIVKCSADTESQHGLQDGTLANIGRFPWLGVIQHTFYMGGSTRFAVTPAVLVHPAYAIASADDMASIPHENLANSTRFIVWYSKDVKYGIRLLNYVLHPEYEDRTVATLALVELKVEGHTVAGVNPKAVLPVCLPFTGAGSFSSMYAVGMTDANKDLQKEIHHMKYVDGKVCKEFYEKNDLAQRKMSPVRTLCASSHRPMPVCVWDSGVALITSQDWGFWKLIGFSVRGPGCGAPARFLMVHDYLTWIDEIISQPEPGAEIYKIGLRRFSPVAMIMYKVSDIVMPKEIGECNRNRRGSVIYKDSMEVTTTKAFAQGFFYLSVTELSTFTCALVNMEDITMRTHAVIWTEHYCYKELMNKRVHGEDWHGPLLFKRQECFMYFKTAAFVQFRFAFSFKALVEVTLYGKISQVRTVPNPRLIEQTTDSWLPTDRYLKWETFIPWRVFLTPFLYWDFY